LSGAEPTPGEPAAHEFASEVIRACRSLGFASAGITDARGATRADFLADWLKAGRHGQMDWMEEHAAARADIRCLLPNAKSVVMVSDRYASASTSGVSREVAPGRGRVAKYALGRDYHEVVKRRLQSLADRLRARFKSEEFRVFVDTAPVLEREHAARAGLGFIGKHTLLIDPEAGSYVLLGGLVTSLALTPTVTRSASGSIDPESHCGTCTKCIDACPTGAIAPYEMDATRCISYLTIEHEGPIDVRFRRAMGDWVFGCDICQDVCPFNHAHIGRGESVVNTAYRARAGLEDGTLDLIEVLGWTAEQRQTQLTVSAGKRASLEMMRRNAAIAAGNAIVTHDLPALKERLVEISNDEGEDAAMRRFAGDALRGSATE